MGRLKLYGTIIGIVLVFAGLKGYYDTFTSEKEPFTISIDEVEKKGLGDHKYVRITNAVPPGNFVYKYKSRLGIKGNVTYIIYPVVSEERLMEYYLDTLEDARLTAKVIVKLDTTFPVSQVDNFEFDTGAVVIEGMVRGSVDSDDKDLLQDDALDLDKNYIYIVKETPNSNASNTVITCLGLGILFFIFRKKKEETPSPDTSNPPQA
ncbi:MAG: hypothetical protein U0V74_03765 [Chitinophagales bacterium]